MKQHPWPCGWTRTWLLVPVLPLPLQVPSVKCCSPAFVLPSELPVPRPGRIQGLEGSGLLSFSRHRVPLPPGPLTILQTPGLCLAPSMTHCHFQDPEKTTQSFPEMAMSTYSPSCLPVGLSCVEVDTAFTPARLVRLDHLVNLLL